MSDESVLRTQAQEAMKTGKLPAHRPQRIWGGPGCGATCALCGKTVATDDVELELQFASDQGFAAANYHVHAQCYSAWERERRNGDLDSHSLPLREDGGMMRSRERGTTNGGERG